MTKTQRVQKVASLKLIMGVLWGLCKMGCFGLIFIVFSSGTSGSPYHSGSAAIEASSQTPSLPMYHPRPPRLLNSDELSEGERRSRSLTVDDPEKI